MSSERQISLLLGTGGGFFAASQSPTPETTSEFLSLLPKDGIDQIDTAAVYPGGNSGRSETLLGAVKAPEKFIIDTKIMVNGGHGPGAGAGDLNRENVLKSFEISCERLGVEKVRTLYCHRPDPGTPLVETARVFDDLYKQGKFEHVSLLIPSLLISGEIRKRISRSVNFAMLSCGKSQVICF
jgi:aflatoxin B1 aldehyde reductase